MKLKTKLKYRQRSYRSCLTCRLIRNMIPRTKCTCSLQRTVTHSQAMVSRLWHLSSRSTRDLNQILNLKVNQTSQAARPRLVSTAMIQIVNRIASTTSKKYTRPRKLSSRRTRTYFKTSWNESKRSIRRNYKRREAWRPEERCRSRISTLWSPNTSRQATPTSS